MISLILLLLAAFFNAVMDAVENAPNFNESIFRKLPKQFWLKEQSWKYVKKIFGYRPDAWHLAKSCMILCIAGAVVVHDLPVTKWFHIPCYLIVLGVVWNLSFNLFYHIVFKVK